MPVPVPRVPVWVMPLKGLAVSSLTDVESRGGSVDRMQCMHVCMYACVSSGRRGHDQTKKLQSQSASSPS